ncbi:PP2C family protein-serine/threonine phosphatase [Paraferrimonas sedimenticola]|uniref:Serine/threonine protein phosphatase n=1 Tax=Paraferrimonas sedimenticola TaxID=375674 RepID=A0AA37RWN6_9GAMM|nr:protein phosphatase 2C domain-containing protein [Paraferrimonas sedimenticola]GLP96831.1 serine/threonine protein phosphatase [Paraferrimonas sedimenticola]
MNSFLNLSLFKPGTKSNGKLKWHSESVCNVGCVRKVNEDSILDRPQKGIWVVADGMGGHNAGDHASSAVVTALDEIHPDHATAQLEQVEQTLQRVNSNLLAEANGGKGISGTTVIVMLAHPPIGLLLWAGDSRCYRLRDGQLESLTRDHSYVETLLQAGDIGLAEAESHPMSNVITQAVGANDKLVLEPSIVRLRAGDRYLLCSDGIYRELSETSMSQLLQIESTQACCQAIETEVMRAGARDNFSAIVIDISL